MSKMIFVNLPVQDLPASISFYQQLGFNQNMQFSDDTAACMVWSDSIFVMLLTHAKWQTFTTRPIPASGSSEVMLALNADSIDAVNQFVATAGAAGGTADVNPVQDLGFMFSRSALDLDGHLWEVFWMDPAALSQ
jgi:hypothetical protein